MSTVIECPECSTRYKMNKAIPEGGRYVKCARCGHQWRVVPEEALSGTAKTLGARQNIMVDESAASPASAAQPSSEAAHGGFADDSWQARREFHAFAVSSMQNEQQPDAGNGSSGASVIDRNTLKNAWMDFDTDSPSSASSYSHGTSNGYSETDSDTGSHDFTGGGDSEWSQRLQRPWRDGDDETQSDDPETAIRTALNAALEQPGQAPEEPATAAEPFNDFWEGFSAEREGSTATDAGIAYGSKDLKTVAAEIESARRSSVIYDSIAARDGVSGDDTAPDIGADTEADSFIQSGLADALRAELAPKAASAAGKDGARAFAEDGQGDDEGDGYHYDTDFLDGDTASLQNQLEKFGHMPYEEPRRGGLAAVAAWAVFLSIASGLVLALVNFRNDMVAALPGTAGFYSLVGLASSGQPVDFSNVSYRWTVSDGKPMVEVTGQVVNRTNRTVQVPQVLINMRDSANSEPVRTTASVQSRLLAGGRSADFSLEFAVSKDISQIELEFDKMQ